MSTVELAYVDAQKAKRLIEYSEITSSGARIVRKPISLSIKLLRYSIEDNPGRETLT